MPDKRLVRLYQGRIARAEALGHPAGRRRKAAGSPSPKAPPSPPVALEEVWAHHALFQDAVNYYLVALAALAAPGGDAPMSGLRQRMADCWEPFTRGPRRFRGLRASLEPYLPAGDCAKGIEPAFRAILAGNPVSPEILAKAVNSLASDLTGPSAVQQRGRDRWPMFCDPQFSGTFPGDAGKRDRESAKTWLPGFLHDPATSPAEARDRLDLRLFANTARGKPPYAGERAKGRLCDAVDAFAQSAELADCERWKALIKTAAPTFDAYSAGGAGAGKRLARINAFLLLKYVEASPATLALLRNTFAGPGPEAPRGAPGPAAPQACQEDPIREARGERGFVFPAFTSLPSWGGDGRQPKWKEFDIAAFKEALKTVNQYQQRTKARESEADQIDAQLRWMKGPEDGRGRGATPTAPGPKPPAGAEPEAESEAGEDLPVLGGDPRWGTLRCLLEQLAKDNEIGEGYGLSRRSLRGFARLRDMWRSRVKPETRPTDALVKELLDLAAAHQKKDGDAVGNVNLFRALCQPEYWVLWREPTDAEQKARSAGGFAADILQAHRRYLELEQEAERKRERIRFTPADARESPRQFLFSDLAGRGKPSHLPGALHSRLAVEVSIARRGGAGNWREERVRLYYTAPRLRRDGLRKAAGEDLAAASWLPPVAAALGLAGPALQDLRAAPVGLMHSPGRDGRPRLLLNFPLSLDPSRLRQPGGASSWAAQMAASGDRLFYLRWPKQAAPGKLAAGQWWQARQPFACLAVDLGQRDAGAFALLSVRPDCAPPGKSPERRVGHDGEQSWSASLAACGLLRLPGEDARILRRGEWRSEPYGEKGRPAGPGDTADAERICRGLGQPPEDWLGAQPARLAFPEQNSRLLRAARSAQRRLATLQRWSWMLGGTERSAKALSEISGDQYTPAEWRELARLGELATLRAAVMARASALRAALPRELAAIANRCLPRRGKTWRWEPHPDQPGWHELRAVETPGHRPFLAGQRGLSMERIEQIEDLRRRLQSLNRALQREPGAPPLAAREMREQPAPDCCPEILAKLDRLKRQRVNQTAHLILAQALGVRPRPHQAPEAERRGSDLHAEYERIPGRQPVAFIVLEDLSRYLGSQDRPPRENGRLMKWCHREILAKAKELAEPFGVPVLETSAAYSSRFCSRTGVAGFRAVDLTPAAAEKWPWRAILGDKSDALHEKVALLFDWLEAANRGRKEAKKPPRSLLAPDRGGPLFVSARDRRVMQADINAAVNLGLRAIAAPDAGDIHPRIRAEVEGEGLRVRAGSKRERARWGVHPPAITLEKPGETSALLKQGSWPNFFADVGRLAVFDRACVEGMGLPAASGRGLWGSLRQMEWGICMEINRRRMEGWGVPAAGAVAAAAEG
jgi:hypothetical protein